MKGQNAAEAVARAWAWEAKAARCADSHARATDSWVPPVQEELVRTAQASGLRRWCPSTSHNVLRLATGLPPWDPDGDDDCRELPGSVSFDRGGPGGSPVFHVWSGLLMRSPDPVLVLTTPDASVAVAALVELLGEER